MPELFILKVGNVSYLIYKQFYSVNNQYYILMQTTLLQRMTKHASSWSFLVLLPSRNKYFRL